MPGADGDPHAASGRRAVRDANGETRIPHGRPHRRPPRHEPSTRRLHMRLPGRKTLRPALPGALHSHRPMRTYQSIRERLPCVNLLMLVRGGHGVALPPSVCGALRQAMCRHATVSMHAQPTAARCGASTAGRAPARTSCTHRPLRRGLSLGAIRVRSLDAWPLLRPSRCARGAVVQ